MIFKVVLQEAEEGGYVVSCPALPERKHGCNIEINRAGNILLSSDFAISAPSGNAA